MTTSPDPGASVQGELARFAAELEFELDPFQRRACVALESGHGVLVCAPTGAGKTIVGEFAVHLALASGGKCFYTTPIKALSNQKHHDFVARYGKEQIGLLTGDVSVNAEAPVVVMTTEVLRNMLYADSPALRGLSYVVMDEVHFLADRMRGAVWEEVILHLPADVRLVSLSATVSNAEEFGGWIQTVRGDTSVIVDDHRPVPLWQHMLVGKRLFDLFDYEAHEPGDRRHAIVDPNLLRHIAHRREADRLSDWRGPRRGGGGSGSGRSERSGFYRPPSRPDVIRMLDADGLLPAITFVFSRVGCDAAVTQCLRSSLRLTTEEERAQIAEVIDHRCGDLEDSDLAVLGYYEWREALLRGIAAHHAGLLPVFRHTVEELFTAGLIRAVFATETLALGINMPARTVVLERLVKYNGEQHLPLTPGEYTQLTGRAGRRGIDVEGHAVVVWHPGLEPERVAGLASTRTYPLRSSFRPSYNMAVNLVGSVGRLRAGELLECSFAQFQADRAVVGLARQVSRNETELDRLAAAAGCSLGDAGEYAELARQVGELARRGARESAAARRAAAAISLEALRVGDVLAIPSGRRAGMAVVVDVAPPPTVLTMDRKLRRLTVVDLAGPVSAVARMKMPRTFNLRSPASRRDIAASLRTAVAGLAVPAPARADGEPAALGELRARLARHPVHGCPERAAHLRAAERHRRLATETAALRRRVEGRTNSIARTFEEVCALLEEFGYLAAGEVTPAGRLLAGVYAESDLLVAECLRSGAWAGLSPAELAAVASACGYETRRDDAPAPRLPRGPVRDGLAATGEVYARLAAAEAEHKLAFLRPPDPGFAWPAYRWASGRSLGEVLAESDLPAGDFVRWTKQTIDLVDQIATVAAAGWGAAELAGTARSAVAAMRRGVVAFSSIG
jgi:ATP-dependent RNA helicase HelY